jgi:UDP-glucose 4-epimerase
MLRGPHIIPSAFAAYQDRRPFMLAGNDFGTPDGTCIRDYVSIMTVCHAIKKLIDNIGKLEGALNFNVSSGTGTSNMDIVSIIARKVSRRFDYEYTSRRPGDPPYLVADNSKLETYIGRLPQQPVDHIVSDVYKYYKTRGIIND